MLDTAWPLECSRFLHLTAESLGTTVPSTCCTVSPDRVPASVGRVWPQSSRRADRFPHISSPWSLTDALPSFVKSPASSDVHLQQPLDVQGRVFLTPDKEGSASLPRAGCCVCRHDSEHHEDAKLHRSTQGALPERRVVCREARSVSQGAAFSHAEAHFHTCSSPSRVRSPTLSLPGSSRRLWGWFEVFMTQAREHIVKAKLCVVVLLLTFK